MKMCWAQRLDSIEKVIFAKKKKLINFKKIPFKERADLAYRFKSRIL